jgi:hypothetical protein
MGVSVGTGVRVAVGMGVSVGDGEGDGRRVEVGVKGRVRVWVGSGARGAQLAPASKPRDRVNSRKMSRAPRFFIRKPVSPRNARVLTKRDLQ